MTRIASLVVVILGLIAPAAASAIVARPSPRYAAPGASGPEPCVASSPCALKAAVDDAPQDGAQVVVNPGDYSLPSGITMTKGLNVHGVAGQPRPRLLAADGYDGQVMFVNVASAGNVLLTRLEIKSLQIPLHVYQGDTISSGLVLSGTGNAAALYESTGTSVLRDSVVRNAGANSTAVFASDGTLALVVSATRRPRRGARRKARVSRRGT